MSADPLVSIIVPVYNAEAYVRDCIESLLKQTYKKIEVILINDGSTDKSGLIVDDLAAVDRRIKAVHKKNGGVSSARNVGLEMSSGEYIMFVDSDDWVDESMVEIMSHALKRERVDMVSCGMRRIGVNGIIREVAYDYHPIDSVLCEQDVYLELVKELLYGGGSLCCRLISRSLVGSDRFIEGMRVSEDQEWLLRVARKIKSGVYIPDRFYNVRMRQNSATTRSSVSDIDDIEVVNQQIIAWAYKNRRTDDIYILNALFARSRLQYSAAIRAGCEGRVIAGLREKMKTSYKRSAQLPPAERIKYYISLLPPVLYRQTRLLLKKLRSESV